MAELNGAQRLHEEQLRFAPPPMALVRALGERESSLCLRAYLAWARGLIEMPQQVGVAPEGGVLSLENHFVMPAKRGDGQAAPDSVANLPPVDASLDHAFWCLLDAIKQAALEVTLVPQLLCCLHQDKTRWTAILSWTLDDRLHPIIQVDTTRGPAEAISVLTTGVYRAAGRLPYEQWVENLLHVAERPHVD